MRNLIQRLAAVAIIVAGAGLLHPGVAKAGDDSSWRHGCWYEPPDSPHGCNICADGCDPLINQRCCLIIPIS